METTIISAEKTARPKLLTVLCILSFIWSGFWTLVSLICTIAPAASLDFMEKYWFGGGRGGITPIMVFVIFIILFVLYGVSLLGAIKIFQMKKWGFWAYLIPNSIMLFIQAYTSFLETIFIDIPFIVYFIVCNVFIVLYGLHYKKMK